MAISRQKLKKRSFADLALFNSIAVSRQLIDSGTQIAFVPLQDRERLRTGQSKAEQNGCFDIALPLFEIKCCIRRATPNDLTNHGFCSTP